MLHTPQFLHLPQLTPLNPLSLRQPDRSRKVLPRRDAPDEAGGSPLPPEAAEERHAVLPEPGEGEHGHLAGVCAPEQEEGPVLNLGGGQGRLGGLDEVVVDRRPGGDELAAGREPQRDCADGHERDVASRYGEGRDLDWVGVLRRHRCDGVWVRVGIYMIGEVTVRSIRRSVCVLLLWEDGMIGSEMKLKLCALPNTLTLIICGPFTGRGSRAEVAL